MEEKELGEPGPVYDPVHNVKHYELFRGIESKQILELIAESDLVDHLSAWELHCFLTSLKYRIRAGNKGDAQQDIDKAERYKKCLR